MGATDGTLRDSMRTLKGIVPIVIGCLFLVFRERYTRHVARWQRKLLGVEYDEVALRRVQAVTVVCAITLIGMGVLILLGVGRLG